MVHYTWCSANSLSRSELSCCIFGSLLLVYTSWENKTIEVTSVFNFSYSFPEQDVTDISHYQGLTSYMILRTSKSSWVFDSICISSWGSFMCLFAMCTFSWVTGLVNDLNIQVFVASSVIIVQSQYVCRFKHWNIYYKHLVSGTVRLSFSNSLPDQGRKKVTVKVTRSCLTLCDPMAYTVLGILQARIRDWVAIPFSKGSFQPRDWTQVSHIAGGFFTSWATREAQTREEEQSSMEQADIPSIVLSFLPAKHGSVKHRTK